MKGIKLISRVLMFSSLISVTSASLAGESYFGGGLAAVKYAEDGIDDEASMKALYGRFGSYLNEYFSAEMRFGLGVDEGTVTERVLGMSVDVDVELNHFIGAYIRGGVPVTSGFTPYVIVGFTRAEVEASLSGFSATADESDTSYGLGADIDVGESVKLNIEYMNYIDKDGGELDGVSIGLLKTF